MHCEHYSLSFPSHSWWTSRQGSPPSSCTHSQCLNCSFYAGSMMIAMDRICPEDSTPPHFSPSFGSQSSFNPPVTFPGSQGQGDGGGMVDILVWDWALSSHSFLALEHPTACPLSERQLLKMEVLGLRLRVALGRSWVLNLLLICCQTDVDLHYLLIIYVYTKDLCIYLFMRWHLLRFAKLAFNLQSSCPSLWSSRDYRPVPPVSPDQAQLPLINHSQEDDFTKRRSYTQGSVSL